MAISANSVFEARADATAGNVNGGFFVTGASGTDYSQQTTAQYAISFTSAGAGSTILCATASSDMVGNGLRTTAGTNVTNNMWFEITSVVVGVSITVSTNAAGTAICTGAATGGTANIGGALSLNSTLDDDVFEQMIGGNTVYVRGTSGVLGLGEAISIASTSATSTAPINIIGYNTTRGDNPNPWGGVQPVIAMAANSISLAQYWNISFISFTTTAAAGITTAIGCNLNQVKIVNTSTAASRTGLTVGQRTYTLACEAVSQNGTAITTSSTSQYINGCYAHDSSIGIAAASNGTSISNCVVNSCSTNAMTLTGSTVGNHSVINCTLRGSSGKVGTGINILAADTPAVRMTNITISGFTTGVLKSTTNQGTVIDYTCNYYDNTTDATNFTKSSTDIAVDPQFVDVAEISGTTATTSGSVLTDSGADFSSVEDNVDFLRVVSGTGVTTGIYLITSHTTTTLTVNNALGTSGAGNVVYVVPTGHNLSIGTNLRRLATPLRYGTETTNALDIGGVQRIDGSSFIFGA